MEKHVLKSKKTVTIAQMYIKCDKNMSLVSIGPDVSQKNCITIHKKPHTKYTANY